MRHWLATALRRTGLPLWYSLLALAIGLAAHVGTALLRLNSFLPTPQIVDFGSYYASAFAIRHGYSPYFPPSDFAAILEARTGLAFSIPPLNSPPIWAWLIQPLTFLRYNAAAWLWLLLLLATLLVCTRLLIMLAGIRVSSWPGRAALFGVVLTFGPVFLTLTLGQNSLFLLLAALLIARAAGSPAQTHEFQAAGAWILAIAAKLFPGLWLPALFFGGRGRILRLTAAGLVIALGISALLQTRANQQYWLEFLPARAESSATNISVDDQSLLSLLERLGRPYKTSVPGLGPTELEVVDWDVPWHIPPEYIRAAFWAMLLVLVVMLTRLSRRHPAESVGIFLLWMLLSLMVMPHMERYNHVLLLPAMAWLWKKERQGSVFLAYALAGLSRLNHLWVLLLPAPFGPLATGIGLYAVITLGAGIISVLESSDELRP